MAGDEGIGDAAGSVRSPRDLEPLRMHPRALFVDCAEEMDIHSHLQGGVEEKREQDRVGLGTTVGEGDWEARDCPEDWSKNTWIGR